MTTNTTKAAMMKAKVTTKTTRMKTTRTKTTMMEMTMQTTMTFFCERIRSRSHCADETSTETATTDN